jgi:predicted ATP-grasp superfamily ATP-dependent carboligase
MRSLGSRGVPIVALTDHTQDFARFSRYCRHTIEYPPVSARFSANCPSTPNAVQVTERLLNFALSQQHRPIFFATSDWFVAILVQQQAKLSRCFEYAWLSPETYALIKDKASMWEFCLRAGVDTPPTRVLINSVDVRKASRTLAFPCVLKPVRNFDIELPLFDHDKVVVLRSGTDLERAAAEHPEIVGATVVQEMIEGGDDQVVQCTLAVGRGGDVLGVSTVRKIHQYPAHFGSMCYGRSEHIPEIIEPAIHFMTGLEYRGLASLEFKFSRRDNRFYFIEINPRLPWYNSLFAASRPNLAYLNYLDLCGQSQPNESAADSRRNVYWSSFVEEYKRWSRERHRLERWFALLAAVLRSRAHAWWDWRDPRPFLASAACIGRTILWKLFQARKAQRTSVTGSTTQPMHHNPRDGALATENRK